MSGKVVALQKRGIIERMADQYFLEPEVFRATVKATCMPENASVEEFISCMMVAHQHNLNPITREIYFMKTKGGGIQPIVSIDGWIRKCNDHPAFDGIEFVDERDDKGNLFSVTCRIYRKDRSRPMSVTEYMSECKRSSEAWKLTPSRLLRHRALMQCARYAFGFAGIMGDDEFERWQEAPAAPTAVAAPASLQEAPDIPDDIPEVPADDEPITDVAGYLAQIDGVLAGCETEQEVQEAWEQDEQTVETRIERSQRQQFFDCVDRHMQRVRAA